MASAELRGIREEKAPSAEAENLSAAGCPRKQQILRVFSNWRVKLQP